MINNLKATKRETKTAGELSALRTKGLIPAILYGGSNPSLKLSIEEKGNLEVSSAQKTLQYL